ncbi:phosphate acyltransferase PlsX [Serpentinicella sp. ANB-PHB4]|uniref:phosphate acyltransferase PlsX n=1 Tax=Serpentinicella sp. ANB-PHB4 TaxID=3074076 RepID=UPI00285F083C|nr:phosphate acyltransferase PlsX [Serpentinicella sp. ANB-PHB4]MDR5658299.1 phosphate acyltransferase PlsX [Serpentinicella sp. ANB-PHB4]
MKVVLDGMGGDFGPEVTVRGAVDAVKLYEVDIAITGDESSIKNELKKYEYPSDRIEVIHCDEIITNEDSPVSAIRKKKNSSMVVAINLVKERKAEAIISAGNTGALLAGGLFILGRIKGIDRPALAIPYPTLNGVSVLMDGGANANCKPRNFLEFAHMGSVFASKVLKISNPRVHLVNIGVEETKGNDLAKESYQLMKKSNINFQGNIEAREIPSGLTDVMICDGFTGNIILKLTEGIASTIFSVLKEEFTKNTLRKLGASLVKPGLVDFKKRFDYTEYGGTPFLGVDGILIKAHGSSNSKAIMNAIKQSIISIENNVVNDISKEIQTLGEDIVGESK